MHPELRPQTLLIAYWPWPEPPDRQALQTELAQHGQVKVLDLADARAGAPPPRADELPDPDWLLALDHPPASAPVFVWVGAVTKPSFVVGADVLDGTARERTRYGEARWQVSIQHALELHDPTASYRFLLQLALQLVPELPALYDPHAMVLRPGAAVERLCRSRTPPPADTLYRTHAVVATMEEECGTPTSPVWVHTHGLARTGLPDLELLDVPPHCLTAAAKLVNLLAACCIGEPETLREGMSVEVVRGHPVSVRSLAEVAARLRADQAGSLQDDARSPDHLGYRMAVVDPDAPARTPIGCLEALAAGATVAGGSRLETRRRAERARDAWPAFGMAFARHRTDADYEFIVQLGHPVAGAPPVPGGLPLIGDHVEEREHLWFQVLAIAPDRVRARLLDEPLAVPALRPGDVAWHDLDLLSDWTVGRPEGPLRPQDV